MNTLAIIYISCNLYSNLWFSFFKVFNKYVTFKINIYLCTDIEIEETLLNELNLLNINILIYGNVSTLNSGGNFYDRLLYHLDNINYKYLFYFTDDMFPSKKINEYDINNILNIMETNDNIKLIKLSLSSAIWYPQPIVTFNNIKFTQANNNIDQYIINLQPFIIKKDLFYNFLLFCKDNYKQYNIQHLNGGLEILGSIYFKKYPIYIALRVIDEIIKVYGGPMGIVTNGIIRQDALIILKKIENVEIKTYEKNCIFEITQNVLDTLGEQNKIRISNHINK